MAGVVALSYSEALFSLGKEREMLDTYKDQLGFVNQQLKDNDEFKRILAHPKMHKEAKKEMIASVFGTAIDHTLLNFLKLLIDKSRFQNLDAISKEFVKRYNKEYNIEVAFVKCAKPLTSEEATRIQTMLEKKLNKQIEMRISQDSDLIAGVRIKIGDIVLDHTAKNRIDQLKVLAHATDSNTLNRGECK